MTRKSVGRGWLVLVVASAVLTVAAAAGAATNWSSFGTLRNVEVDHSTASNGTSTYIWFTSPPTGVPSCSGTQYVAMGTTDNVKQMTSLASQALLSGKPFQVHFKGDCVDADGNAVTTAGAGYARFDNASIGW